MYVKSGAEQLAFDAVVGVEGHFKFRPNLDAVPTVEVLMVFINSTTKTTYGSCPVQTLTPRTLESLITFLRNAEEDFGNAVFGGGVLTPFGPLMAASGAETDKGLPKGLGEG
jgi:hypothetical protein